MSFRFEGWPTVIAQSINAASGLPPWEALIMIVKRRKPFVLSFGFKSLKPAASSLRRVNRQLSMSSDRASVLFQGGSS